MGRDEYLGGSGCYGDLKKKLVCKPFLVLELNLIADVSFYDFHYEKVFFKRKTILK